TARAKLIASDFRLVAHHRLHFSSLFASRSSALVRPGKGQRTRPERRAASNRFRWIPGNNLQVEERTNRAGIDSIEHLLEQIKTLFLILNQRIFLSVTDQPDALLQVVQREQVVFPLRVDDVEHDDALVG